MSSSEILRTLEAATRGSFQETRDRFFWWLAASTIIVVVGVIIEEFEYVISWRWIRRLLPLKLTLPVHRIETFARRISKLGWLLIILGVAGEGTFEGLVSKADGWLQDFNNIISASQEAEIRQLGDVAARARSDAESAKSASDTAMTAAGHANGLALSARQEADTFEKDIASAKRDAAEAKSLLSEARQMAADAKSGLTRLQSARTVLNPNELADSLKKFKGTEFTFDSVFQDKESLNLIVEIDSLLKLSEWNFVKPPAGFPAINLYGKEDGNAVRIGFGVGIEIFVNSPDAESITSLAIEQLPLHIRAAVALKQGLEGHLSPKANEQDVPKIRVDKGDSKTVRIAIGKHP